MDSPLLWLLTAIALYIYFNPRASNVRINLPGLDNFRREHHYRTPGRNARTREVKREREERRAVNKTTTQSRSEGRMPDAKQGEEGGEAPFSTWEDRPAAASAGAEAEGNSGAIAEGESSGAPERQNSTAASSGGEMDARALRAAAAEARLARDRKASAMKRGPDEGKPGKAWVKMTALEQASYENVGWRNADAMAEARAWN